MIVPTGSGSLPPEVLDLGQPLAVFRGSRLLSVIALIVGPLGVLLFPGAAIAGYATGGIKEGSPAGPILIVLAVLMALAGGYLIYAGLSMRKLRYAVCPGGIARIKGERVEVLPWEGQKKQLGSAHGGLLFYLWDMEVRNCHLALLSSAAERSSSAAGAALTHRHAAHNRKEAAPVGCN
jgi:hypothetical protein